MISSINKSIKFNFGLWFGSFGFFMAASLMIGCLKCSSLITAAWGQTMEATWALSVRGQHVKQWETNSCGSGPNGRRLSCFIGFLRLSSSVDWWDWSFFESNLFQFIFDGTEIFAPCLIVKHRIFCSFQILNTSKRRPSNFTFLSWS